MQHSQDIRLSRLIVKIVAFLILLNIICVVLSFLPIGKLSLYNFIFPGRLRLPFGENPNQSYNLTLNNLDAMVASHEISVTSKDSNKYRVVLIGDSSIWGFLQSPEETLAGILKSDPEINCNSRTVEIFNFGYPSLSILKDLFFLEKALTFEPDLVLWFVTLESLNHSDQLSTPLVANNPIELNRMISQYDLSFPSQKTSFLDRTIINQRRNFADMVRLQLYGVMWAATGIDQDYPETYTPAQRDFEVDVTYKGYTDQTINGSDLALEVIQKSIVKNSSVDFILINEPILIASGENSDLRYNYYYPRWAYDQYREIINRFAAREQIKLYDFWDLVPEDNFTNSAIHLDIMGENFLAAEVKTIVEEHCEP
jgi:hypothetical protein